MHPERRRQPPVRQQHGWCGDAATQENPTPLYLGAADTHRESYRGTLDGPTHFSLGDLSCGSDSYCSTWQMDISPVTDVLWKRFYQQQFGEDNTNLVVKKMKQSGARYKWKDLFKVK